MKKVLLLIFVALIASASFAQARFSTTFRCGYDFPNGSVNNKSAGGDLIFGSQIGDRWNVGVGSGFYYCNLLLEEYNKTKNTTSAIVVGGHVVGKHEETEIVGKYRYHEAESYVPIFLHASYRLTDKKFTPFVSLDLGYSIMQSYTDLADECAKLEAHIRPGIGVERKWQCGSIYLELSEKFQQVEMKKADYKWYCATSLSIGFKFYGYKI